LQPARRRAKTQLSVDGKEVVASFTFNVLVTSAADLTPKALQLDLLQQLVGLKPPGFPTLTLIMIGKFTNFCESAGSVRLL
jgi:hypothetical protein